MPGTATSYNPSYRYGEANPVLVPIEQGVAVNVGDLAWEQLPTRTVTDGATTSGSPTLTSTSAQFSQADVGATVSGTGIPANTTLLAVTASNTATMSANATATGGGVSVTITIVGPPSVYPAPYYPWPAAAGTGLTTLQTAQSNFAQQFLGVAGQSYDGSNFVSGMPTGYGIQDGTLRVDTGGVFDFACPSQTFNAGDLLGPAKDVGNNLTGQTVTLVGTAQQAGQTPAGATVTYGQMAIARAVQSYPNATTTVRAQLLNTRFGPAAH